VTATASFQPRVFTVLRVCRTALPLLGISLACAMCLLTRKEIAITHPSLLVFASLILILPIRFPPGSTVRTIMALFLSFVPIDQIAGTPHTVSIFGTNLLVSLSLPVLILCAAGRCFGTSQTDNTRDTPLPYIATVLIGLILTHLGVLYVLLTRFYNYGHERDIPIIGHSILFMLLFLCLRDVLASTPFRRILATILLPFYILYSIMGN